MKQAEEVVNNFIEEGNLSRFCEEIDTLIDNKINSSMTRIVRNLHDTKEQTVVALMLAGWTKQAAEKAVEDMKEEKR